MDKGEYTGTDFVDLKKAFDTVNHGHLLSKLPSYGQKEENSAGLKTIYLIKNSLYP